MFCVSGVARKVWLEVTGVIPVTSSLHLSPTDICVCCEHVPGAALVTIITTSNLSLGTICDPTILNISSQFFSWHFFSMTLWTKVSFNWYTGCKDVRRMMQCCSTINMKSVAFLSAVFCPVTLFVAVAESRLSVRISAHFSQDGEICSSSSRRRMDKQLAHTEIAQQRGAVGYVKVQWLYSLCLSVVLCNTV